MLTSVTMQAQSIITIPVGDASPTDPYFIKTISGLGPPDMDLTINDNVGDGSDFQNRRTSKREIVMEIGLNPDYYTGETIDDLRDMLYSLIEPDVDQDFTILQFNDSKKSAKQTIAYVEKVEPNYFAKDPEVQITFLSPDPWLYSPESTLIDGLSLGPNAHKVSVPYAGTARIGIILSLSVIRYDTSPPITIVKFPTSETFADATQSMTFDPSVMDLQTDDKIVINTVPGQKAIYRDRFGVRTNVLFGLVSTTPWFTLSNGDQTFQTTFTVNPYFEYQFDSIEYVEAYRGV